MASGLKAGDVMTRRVETVEATEEASFPELLRRFRGFRHLPVVDHRGLAVGMLARTDLLEHAARSGARRPVRVAELMSQPVVSIHEEESVEAAAQLMVRHRIHSLVVLGPSGEPRGILTDSDLLSAIAGERLAISPLEQEPVDLLMTRDPLTIDPEATLEEAAGRLAESGVRHLPVVDSDGRLLGLLSERDLRERLGTDLRRWTHAALSSLQERVESVMVHSPTALRSGSTVADALDAFAEERVGAFPVLDQEDRPIGVLSYVDVLRWLRERAGAIRPAPAQEGISHS